jgi:hypothetical protein
MHYKLKIGDSYFSANITWSKANIYTGAIFKRFGQWENSSVMNIISERAARSPLMNILYGDNIEG